MGRRRHWGETALLLLACLLLAAGCGSSDDVTATEGPSVPDAADAAEEFEPGVLAQGWMAHGRSIAVRADGSFEISYRTYRWCSTDPPPCDPDAGGTIGHGGRATGTFDGGAGPAWTGTITEAVEPEVWPPGPVEATYDPETGTLEVRSTVEPMEPWVFCGPTRHDDRCGA